jgi:cell division protein FtsL
MSQAQERRAEEIVDNLKGKLYTVRREISDYEAAISTLKLKEKDLQAQLSRAQQSSSY